MKIKDLSLADLYALYWHFSDLIPYGHKDDLIPETNYAKDPSVIYEACCKELNKRLISMHHSLIGYKVTK